MLKEGVLSMQVVVHTSRYCDGGRCPPYIGDCTYIGVFC